jgi:hypothetical protein
LEKERVVKMIYQIIWKYKGVLYTEYENIEVTKYILDFLNGHFEKGFELVNITLYKE